MAQLTPNERPFPPGRYPLVIVGSGPGGLQLSYALRRLGVEHAVLSADEGPGGMFRRWPFFQRLLSWTKPYAPAERGRRGYERYDWNSLLSDEEGAQALQVSVMDGSSSFPSREEMERNLALFATRTGLRVRYGCRWERTRREEGPAGERFVLETSDGPYEAGTVVFAVGVAEPVDPPMPGAEFAAHYAATREAASYADKRVFIIGKQNSGFELASGLLPWARQLVLASPSPTRLSVNTRSLVGVRARYVQPYEDHVLGGGVVILDAAIERIERDGGALRVVTRASSGVPGGGEDASAAFVVDEVIAATGFVAPLRDLPALGVVTFGQSRLPAQTPYWESATVPGIFFAGTITQGAQGLRKHGLPSNSGAVHGARYNALVLAEHLATTRFGRHAPRPAIAADALVPFLLDELTWGGAVWHQRSYLARVVEFESGEAARDAGLQPLAHVVDDPGPDAIAVTVEADGTGAFYPAIYVRREGRVEERLLPPDPLLDFTGARYASAVADAVASVGRGTAATR